MISADEYQRNTMNRLNRIADENAKLRQKVSDQNAEIYGLHKRIRELQQINKRVLRIKQQEAP